MVKQPMKGENNMADEKNVTVVKQEDKNFIRALLELPPEKKVLLKGIIIGMDLQEKKKVG